MIIHEYDGVLAQIVAAINDAGGPPKVRRIELTEEEMREVWSSNAFKESVSNYYGSTSAPTLEKIIADRDGNIISMYLNGVLICVGPWRPTGAYAALTWGPVNTLTNESTSFVTDDNYLYVGKGNPSNGMVVGANGDIELALAIRKAGDPTNYASGENYAIEITDDEAWTFVVSVGSLNTEIPNILDMYNVQLQIENENLEKIVFTLGYGEVVNGKGEKRNNYIWYRGTQRAITDSAQSPAFVDDNGTPKQVGVATQMIQQMRFDFISRYISASDKTANGSFLGTYRFTLSAAPKFGDKLSDVVGIEASAIVTKKS